MRYHYTPTRMAIIKDGQHQMLARTKSNQNSHTLLVEVKNGTTTLGKVLAISFKMKLTPTLGPQNSTLRYSRKTKIYVHTKDCMQISIAACQLKPENSFGDVQQNGQTTVYAYIGRPFNNEKHTTARHNTGDSQTRCSNTRFTENILRDSNYMKS